MDRFHRGRRHDPGRHRHRRRGHPRRRRGDRHPRRPASRAQGLPAPLRADRPRRCRRGGRHPDDRRPGQRRPRPDPAGRRHATTTRVDSDHPLPGRGSPPGRASRPGAGQPAGRRIRVAFPTVPWRVGRPPGPLDPSTGADRRGYAPRRTDARDSGSTPSGAIGRPRRSGRQGRTTGSLTHGPRPAPAAGGLLLRHQGRPASADRSFTHSQVGSVQPHGGRGAPHSIGRTGPWGAGTPTGEVEDVATGGLGGEVLGVRGVQVHAGRDLLLTVMPRGSVGRTLSGLLVSSRTVGTPSAMSICAATV